MIYDIVNQPLDETGKLTNKEWILEHGISTEFENSYLLKNVLEDLFTHKERLLSPDKSIAEFTDRLFDTLFTLESFRDKEQSDAKEKVCGYLYPVALFLAYHIKKYISLTTIIKQSELNEETENFLKAEHIIERKLKDFYAKEPYRKGGQLTASYWGEDRNKLKEIWLKLPIDAQKSNKKSLEELQKHTTLSSRKLEEYIRVWRKEKHTQG